MPGETNGNRERGQAFTLEGFVAAIILLTAVLFALQAVVITPTTGGSVDRAAQAQEKQEVRDVLLIAAESGELSGLVRNWDSTNNEWHDEGSGTEAAYTSREFAKMTEFGTVLEKHFVNASGKSYNLDLVAYDNNGNREIEHIVRMGGGRGDSVVSASYTVTVYYGQTLTEPASGGKGFVTSSEQLDSANSAQYPFPPTGGTNPAYTVVEVRVTVW